MGTQKKSEKLKQAAAKALSHVGPKSGRSAAAKPLKTRSSVQVFREMGRPDLRKKIHRAAKVFEVTYVTLRNWDSSLDLGSHVVSEILDVTPRTLSRWNAAEPDLTKQQADRIEVLQGIFNLGCKVLGSEDSFKAWLRRSVLALDGEKPIDLLSTESGRRRVEYALHQIQYGHF